MVYGSYVTLFVFLSPCLPPTLQALYSLSITNASPTPVDGFMLQTNKNSFGLAPVNPVLPMGAIAPGATCSVLLPMTVDPAKLLPGAISTALQVSLDTNLGPQFSKHACIRLLPGCLDVFTSIDGASRLSHKYTQVWTSVEPARSST